MRLKNIYGKLVSKNVSRFIIKWDKPSRSILQFKVKKFLKKYWNGLIVYEEFPVFGTLLKVDILNATLNIAIEVNGQQHSQYHYFHNGSPNAFLKGIKRDYQKSEWLAANNFQLVEIEWNEVDLLTHSFFLDKYGIKL